MGKMMIVARFICSKTNFVVGSRDMVGLDVESAHAAEKGRKEKWAEFVWVVARNGRENFGGATPFFVFCTLIAPVLDFPSDQGLRAKIFYISTHFLQSSPPPFRLFLSSTIMSSKGMFSTRRTSRPVSFPRSSHPRVRR